MILDPTLHFAHHNGRSDACPGRSLPSILGLLVIGFCWGGMSHRCQAQDSDPPHRDVAADITFYNNQVKPILAEHCFECHADDPEDLQGSLAITSHASILRGGDTGPAIDLNSPTESLFLKVINYDIYEMPPDGKMSDDEIKVLTDWVNRGMPFDPADEKDLNPVPHSTVPQVNAESKKWWSFQKVTTAKIRPVNQVDWPTNPIDHFILSRLESAQLDPAPPAPRHVLIRRAYYDLTGLPPTPDQVTDFENDPSPDAFKNLVNELLESPQYGEKWGRHWLDLVRYAESNSFERDGPKPLVWRYRDYVIRSFNDDKPYDQFLTEQLAGDEIQNPTQDSVIATGYYRLGQWDDEPVDALQAKYDDLDDIVATTSQTMLGLTVNCARCHDHKIDPIPQTDYYKMVSFFENIQRYGVRDAVSVHAASIRTMPGESTPQARLRHQQQIVNADRALDEIVQLAKPDFEPVEHEDFQYDMNKLAILKKRVGQQITQDQYNQFEKQLAHRKHLMENPPGSIKVLCVKETPDPDGESFVRVRGNANVKGQSVEPGFISVLSPPEPSIQPPAHGESLGRRLAFAQWLVQADHPLTARVMVNRIWQYHFGRGIVRSASDFGFQGTPPTHPELLDWLAAEFVRRHWSIKEMHRLIMASNTYQMSGAFNAQAFEKDPANDLFWHFNLRRLTAEEIRDSILAVNGHLNLGKMYGPSIFPIMPKEVLAGQSRPGENWGNSSESDRNRRSIYIHVKRSLGVPILTTNDSADTDNTCPIRFITTQPTQALGMMNSEFTNRHARKFAQQIRTRFPNDPRQQVAAILGRVTQRTVNEQEIKDGVALMQSWIDAPDTTPIQALDYFCLMALNLNEFVYVD